WQVEAIVQIVLRGTRHVSPVGAGQPRILQVQSARIRTLLQRDDVWERSGVPDERGACLIGRGQMQRELLALGADDHTPIADEARSADERQTRKCGQDGLML